MNDDLALALPHAARPRPWTTYALALLMTGAATAVALLADRFVAAPNLALVFVLPVVVAAVNYGAGPAFAAAAAGVLALNYFLIEPRFTLAVDEPTDLWALALLLITAVMVSAVAAAARRRELEARLAADRGAALHALARQLVAAQDRTAIAAACADTLARLFEAPAVVLVEAEDEDELKALALAGGAELSGADEEAARWALASRLATRGGAYPIEAAAFDFWPIVTPQRQRAVVGIRISGRDEGRPEAPERLAEMVGGHLAVALDREEYARQALSTRIDAEHERLKAELLAAVSHDLKTPLSTILLTLQSLRRFGPRHPAKARAELLALAEAETARLEAMVSGLLDMNRLEAGAAVVRPTPVSAEALAAAAVAHVGRALAGRALVDEVRPGGRPLLADPALFETALANVLENAARYTPEGSPIRLRSGDDGAMGWVEVLDEGPGFPDPVEPLFEKFTRGVEGDGRPAGLGLGLTIARAFLEAQGGRIEACNRADGQGARVRLAAPLAAPQPVRA